MKRNLLFIAVSFLVLVSCSNQETGGLIDLDLGREGFPCRADKTCNTGLKCNESNICVKDIEEKPECVPECENNQYCDGGVCEDRCPSDMVLIPKGEFLMGSSTGYYGNEEPIHKVKLTKDFCMDKFEFTNKNKNDLSDKVLNAEGKDSEGNEFFYQWAHIKKFGENFSKNNHPLVGVNWYIANRICELQGKRLPTEAEWEYSVRGGEMNDKDCPYGTEKCEEPTTKNACWQKTRDEGPCLVGSFKPNKFGLYDMSGNVFEWVSDWYSEYTAEDKTDPSVSKEPSGQYKPKVLRGGTWLTWHMDDLRGVTRGDYPAYYRDDSLVESVIGFRCALSAKGE